MPARVKFNEAKLQSLVTQWCKQNMFATCAIELKITKTNTIPLSRFADHQIESLRIVKHGEQPLVHKISDAAPGFKPFDMLVFYNQPAYFGICFYKPRKKKIVYLLDIDDFLRLKRQPKRTSLREDDLSSCPQISL